MCSKKKIYLSVTLILFTTSSIFSQYGRVEFSTGGISFTPALRKQAPHTFLTLGTNDKHLFSGHIISSVRMENLTLRTLRLIPRLKVLDKKLKMTVGTHLVALKIDEAYQTKTFSAQEIRLYYTLSKDIRFSSLLLHNKGKNNTSQYNLMVIKTHYDRNKFNFETQLYFRDDNTTYGIAEIISYNLRDHIALRLFLNSTLSNGDTFGTVGLRFVL